MTDVEKVARALCRHDGLPYLTEEGIEGFVDTHWRDWIDAARVAMQATREVDAVALLAEYETGMKLRLHEVFDWLLKRSK